MAPDGSELGNLYRAAHYLRNAFAAPYAADSGVYATLASVPTTIDVSGSFNPQAFIDNGTATIQSRVGGVGTFVTAEGSTLEFKGAVGAGQDVQLALNATIIIDDPGAFKGTLSMVDNTSLQEAPFGEYVELAGLGSANGYSIKNDVLTLTRNGTPIDSVRLAPNTTFTAIISDAGNIYLTEGYGSYKIPTGEGTPTLLTGSGTTSTQPTLPISGVIPQGEVIRGVYATVANAGTTTIDGPGKFAPSTFVDNTNAVINADVVGRGTFVTSEGANLTFGGSVGYGQTAALALNASITIDHPTEFKGQIALVQNTTPQSGPFGEYVDLVGLSTADGYSLKNDLLTITAGSKTLDTIRLAPNTSFTNIVKDTQNGSVYLANGYGIDKIPGGSSAAIALTMHG